MPTDWRHETCIYFKDSAMNLIKNGEREKESRLWLEHQERGYTTKNMLLKLSLNASIL